MAEQRTRDDGPHGAESLRLPAAESMLGELMDLSKQVDSIARYMRAAETKMFEHPDGRVDELKSIYIPKAQSALISHLCMQCKTEASLEIGFGMGQTALVILGSRSHLRKPFKHYVIDPFGLSAAGAQERPGTVVESYLNATFPENFERIRKLSVVGMSGLYDTHGGGITDYIHVDGSHHFEFIVADFLMADLLCRTGGHITFDDAFYPAIETVLNYVSYNRSDYAVERLKAANLAVLKKLRRDERGWSHFRPFPVPDRSDWTI